MNNGYYFRYIKELKTIEKELKEVLKKLENSNNKDKSILYYAKYLLLTYKVLAIYEVLATEMEELRKDKNNTFIRFFILNVSRTIMMISLNENTVEAGTIMSIIVSLYNIICFIDIIIKYINMDRISEWSLSKSEINEILI